MRGTAPTSTPPSQLQALNPGEAVPELIISAKALEGLLIVLKIMHLSFALMGVKKENTNVDISKLTYSKAFIIMLR